MNINEYKKYTNINLSNTSQLKLFNILKDITENVHYLNIFRSYILNVSQLNDASFYDLYEIPNNTFLENIAFEKYSLPNLWWIIAITNNIVNPFEELEPGKLLRILKNDYLYQILKEVKTIGNY